MKGKTNNGYVLFLAIVAALGGILFGYDTAVISGTVSQVTAQFGLDALSSGWYVGCALIGSIFGVAVAGVMSDKLGRRLSMLIAAVLFTTSAVGCAVCGSFDALVVYRIVGGVGIGIVSIVSPMYIAEIAVPKWRGTFVSLYQLAVTIGFLVAYFVNFAILDNAATADYASEWWQRTMVSEMWRGMLGSETIVAALFFVVLFFIPESPRWLITTGKDGAANRVLGKMYTSSEDVQEAFRATRTSINSAEKSEWKALRSPGIMKAVVIGVCIAILGQFMGVNAVLYYGPTIFENAGLTGGNELLAQVYIGIVNVLTTVIALVIIDRVGRKQLVYWGVSGMILSLVAIGIYFLFGEAWGLSNTVLLVLLLFYVFCTAISISAVVWVLLSEMYPNKVRGIAMSIAGFALWIGTYLIGQLTPWMLENLTPSGTFFLFAAMCIPYMLIMWRLVPETTGRSLEEIEEYWTKQNRK